MAAPPGPPEIPSWAETVERTGRGLSWASLVTVLFPIVTFLVFPIKRAFPARLPLYMSFAVFGLCLSLVPGFYEPEKFCPYQAIGITFFGNAGVFWWLIISYNFYQAAVRDKTDTTLESRYLFIGWGLPLILTIVAKAMDQLDTHPHLSMWECWMSDVRGWGQWVFLYVFMGFACLIGLYAWPVIMRRICHVYRDLGPAIAPSHLYFSYVRHVLFITFFFLVFSLMFTYRIVSEVRWPKGAGYALTQLHTVCVCSTGIYMFIVFGLSAQNLRLWYGLLRGHISTPAEQRASEGGDDHDGNGSISAVLQGSGQRSSWMTPHSLSQSDIETENI